MTEWIISKLRAWNAHGAKHNVIVDSIAQNNSISFRCNATNPCVSTDSVKCRELTSPLIVNSRSRNLSGQPTTTNLHMNSTSKPISERWIVYTHPYDICPVLSHIEKCLAAISNECNGKWALMGIYTDIYHSYAIQRICVENCCNFIRYEMFRQLSKQTTPRDWRVVWGWGHMGAPGWRKWLRSKQMPYITTRV